MAKISTVAMIRYGLAFLSPQVKVLSCRRMLERAQISTISVHRGFLELRRHHFAEALEAADLDLAACRLNSFLISFLLVRVVAGIDVLPPWVRR
jgi:hypothetical protein